MDIIREKISGNYGGYSRNDHDWDIYSLHAIAIIILFAHTYCITSNILQAYGHAYSYKFKHIYTHCVENRAVLRDTVY